MKQIPIVRLLFVAIFAFVAAQFAQSATCYWTGGISSAWGTAENWSSNKVPTDDGAFFRSDKFGSNYLVTFDGAYVNNWRTFFNNCGTASDPIVLRANDATYGFTGGDAGDEGIYIGTAYSEGNSGGKDGDASEGDAYVRFETGTFAVGGSSRWYLGNNSYAGHMTVAGATINIPNSFYLNRGSLTVESGTVNVGNGTLNLSASDNATVTMNGGTLVYGDLNVGASDGSTGKLTVNGGTITTQKDWSFRVGHKAKSTGIVELNNGDVTCAYLRIGHDDGSVGYFTMNGGTLTVNTQFLVGWASGATGNFTLNGGTVTASDIFASSGTGTLTFNGGTLKARSAGTLIRNSANLTVTVGENGGTIDSDNKAITVAKAIGGEGGLTFTGGGSVTLEESNDYTGETKIAVRTKLVVANATELARLLANGVTIVKPERGSAKGTYKLIALNDGTDCMAEEYERITKGAGLEGATFAVDVDGDITVTVSHTTQTWAGAANTSAPWSGNNWDEGARFDDGNDAVFATDGAIAEVDADYSAYTLTFNDNAALTGAGTLTLTEPTIAVAEGKAASIAVPLAGAIEKTGAGTLKLGSSRTETTKLSAGTLEINGSGTTLDWSKFTFGTGNTLHVTGGASITYDSYIVVGRDGNDNATLEISGVGSKVQNTACYMSIGDSYNTSGTVTLTQGGKYENTGSGSEGGGLSVGSRGAGVLNVDGGEVTMTVPITLCSYSGSGTSAEVNISNGGKVCANGFIYNRSGSSEPGTAIIMIDGGILKAVADNVAFIQNADQLTMRVGSNGGTIDTAGYAITIAKAISGEGGMTYQGGGTVTLTAHPAYTGVTTVKVGTTLVVPETIAGKKLAFAVPDGLADGVYPVVTVSGEGAFAQNALDDASMPTDSKARFSMSSDGKTIYCIYGSVDNSWTGGAAGNLSDPSCWTLQKVPGNGETAVITGGSGTTLTVPQGATFSPSVIVFPAGSGAVTIAGDGAISGVSVVSNLSSVVQTIDCPLAFEDTFRVHCETHAVNFSGGATAACPDPENTDNAASRALTGNITFEEDWTATGSMVNCYTVPSGSKLFGKAITGDLTTGATILRIEEGGYAEFDSALTGNIYGRISVRGEMVVTGVWVIAGTGNDLVGEEGDESSNGVLRAGGIWKGDDTHEMSHSVYVKIPTIHIGVQGFGTKNGKYYFQFEKNNVVYAASDFEMFGLEHDGNDRDWGFSRWGNGSTTIDTQGHTVTWSCDATGSGGIVKAGEGTLVMNPYGNNMTGVFTVEGGTLRIAKDGAVGSGSVTVKKGASLEIAAGVALNNSSVTLEAGATLAPAANGSTFAAIGNEFSLPTSGTVTIRIDGKRLKSGKHTILGNVVAGTADNAIVDLSSAALEGRKASLSVEDGALVLNIASSGTCIIIR